MSPDLHHLSGAYAVDALDDGERGPFEQHLAGCADCRAEVAELSATAHSLGALTEETRRPRCAAPCCPASARSAHSPRWPVTTTRMAAIRPRVPRAGIRGSEPTRRAARGEAGRRSAGGATVIPIRRRASTWFAAAAAAAVITVGGLAWSPWSDPAEHVTGRPGRCRRGRDAGEPNPGRTHRRPGVQP